MMKGTHMRTVNKDSALPQSGASAFVTSLEPGDVLLTGAVVANVERIPADRFHGPRVRVTMTDGGVGTVGIGVRVYLQPQVSA